MTRITYGLSRNQQKELVDRGRPLRLLLPDDGTIPEDSLWSHVEAVLDVPAAWIQSVRPVSAIVRPYWGARPQGPGVTPILGTIVHGDPPADGICISVGALEVVLASGRARHSPTRWQWPGRYVYDGEQQR